MVDVVDADIGGEPAQHARQVVMRAAVQRRLVKIPVLVAIPECVFELMLDIEQPDADRGREKRNRQMHQQERADARPARSSAPTSAAMPTLVAIVLTQGCQPLRINPNGNRCRKTNSRPDRCRTSPAGGGKAGRAGAPAGRARDIPATVSVSMSPMPRRSRLPECAWWTAWVRRQKS